MWSLLDVLQLAVLYTGVGFQFGLGSISYFLLNEIAPYLNHYLYVSLHYRWHRLRFRSSSSIFESLRLQVHCSSLQAGRAPTFHCVRCVEKNPVGRDLTSFSNIGNDSRVSNLGETLNYYNSISDRNTAKAQTPGDPIYYSISGIHGGLGRGNYIIYEVIPSCFRAFADDERERR
jgi:hypothetical protein